MERELASDLLPRESAGPTVPDFEGLMLLGLTRHQARAYTALLSLGCSKPSEVARVAQLPRPNTYDALAALVGIGAAIELPGKPKQYRPTPPLDWLPAIGKHLEKLAQSTAEALSQVPKVVIAAPQIEGWARLAELLRSGMSSSQDRIVVDARVEVFSKLSDELHTASRRGCEIALLCRGGDLPIPTLAGWVVVSSLDPGAPDSCWVFDQEWALRYRGTGSAARGRRLLDADFAAELDRGMLGQMALVGDFQPDSTAAKAIRRMHSSD